MDVVQVSNHEAIRIHADLIGVFRGCLKWIDGCLVEAVWLVQALMT